MKYLLTIIALIVFAQFSFSQEPHWEEQILELTKGLHVNELVEDPNSWDTWIANVTVKKKMGIYRVDIGTDIDIEGYDSSYVGGIYPLIKPVYDDILPFEKIDKGQFSGIIEDISNPAIDVAVVYKKKKLGVIYRIVSPGMGEPEYHDTEMFFDEISWDYAPGTTVAVTNKDKWGVYDWYLQEMIAECDYASIEDFPETDNTNGLDPYTMEILTSFNKQKDKETIDRVDLNGGNGDGLFKARSRESKKWGLYQYFGDEIVEAIPMKYDSLYHFPWNGNYTAVFNDGKVGCYLSYWSYDSDAKESVPCIYEDYKRYITDDQIPKLAVMKDGKWGWVDWLTGEEKSEFKHETPEDLPYPYYNQEMWLEE